jgi:hypothetical protein
MLVSDASDYRVGTVLKATPWCFLIETGRDSLWVSYDIVFRVDGDRVLLVCAAAGIDQYRVDGAPHGPD